MKIITQDESWILNKSKSAFDFRGYKNKVFVELPFDLSYVQYSKADSDMDYIVFPYADKELQVAVCSLAYDIAANNEWLYPDEENIKISIMIHTDGIDCGTFKASLCIEVQPPVYSEEEKADILASADKNMYHTDFNEYTIWLDIFTSAEAFHCGRGGGVSETVGTYDIEFGLEEQNTLLWFLLQRSQLIP